MRATTKQRPAAPPPTDGLAAHASPVRLRRRPSMVIWSVALVLLGGVLGLAIWSMSSTATEVVAVPNPTRWTSSVAAARPCAIKSGLVEAAGP